MSIRGRVMQRLGDERGFAMVTALLVSMVVLSLGLVVIQLSAHNVDASASDRKRVQAVHVAEAGLNAYLSTLPATPIASLPCDPPAVNLPLSPGAQYWLRVQYYATSPAAPGQEMACPLSARPQSAVVTSTGTAIAEGTARRVSRTMQTEVKLNPLYGAIEFAIFSDRALTLQNRVTLNGAQSSDADVYTNGNFVQENNSEIYGSVYAQGTATISQGIVRQDVWANGSVSLSSVDVSRNVQSSTSSISLANTRVQGSARAGTSISLSQNSFVRVSQIANSPAGPPPIRTLPQIGWDAAAWTNPPPDTPAFDVRTFTTCASAKQFIKDVSSGAVASGKYAVRLTDPATCTWDNTDQGGGGGAIQVRDDLAIVTDGPMTFGQNVTFRGTSATPRLYLIRPYVAGRICSSDSGWPNVSYDFVVGNSTRFEDVNLFMYSQCYLSFGNNNAGGVNAQLIGGRVNVSNQMTFNYRPVYAPGTEPVGFDTDVAYIREITNPV